MNRALTTNPPLGLRLLRLVGLMLLVWLLDGCVRYSVIEPLPHFAANARAANALSARIAAVTERVVTRHGFNRLQPTTTVTVPSNLLASYSNYQKIREEQLYESPGTPEYETQKLTTSITVMTGTVREDRFNLYLVPGDPRLVTTVLVEGQEDWTVLLTARRIARELRADIPSLAFKVRTTSKYSGEF